METQNDWSIEEYKKTLMMMESGSYKTTCATHKALKIAKIIGASEVIEALTVALEAAMDMTDAAIVAAQAAEKEMAMTIDAEGKGRKSGDPFPLPSSL